MVETADKDQTQEKVNDGEPVVRTTPKTTPKGTQFTEKEKEKINEDMEVVLNALRKRTRSGKEKQKGSASKKGKWSVHSSQFLTKEAADTWKKDFFTRRIWPETAIKVSDFDL